MKHSILGIAAAATLATSFGAIPALADPPRHAPAHGWRNKHDDRHSDRRDRAPVRDWRQYRGYDYNRVDPYYGNYYADRYYRDGRYYQPRRLTRADRIYRGSDDRYYCRRSDGTTGLIIGGAIGGLLGRSLDRGDSRTVGTIIGAGAGALLGREVDRGSLNCR